MLGGVFLAILFVSHPLRAQLPRDSLCSRFIGRWVVQGAPSHTRPVDSRPGGQIKKSPARARVAANRHLGARMGPLIAAEWIDHSRPPVPLTSRRPVPPRASVVVAAKEEGAA